MNRPLLLFAVLALVFGLKGCTPDDCKPLYNITQPCWTVEYFIDGKDSTIMLRRTLPDSTNIMLVQDYSSCENGRKGNSLSAIYRKVDYIGVTSISISTSSNFLSFYMRHPKSTSVISDSTFFCNNSSSGNPNETKYYCRIAVQLIFNSSSKLIFQGLKPYEKHSLVFTASNDTSCILR